MQKGFCTVDAHIGRRRQSRLLEMVVHPLEMIYVTEDGMEFGARIFVTMRAPQVCYEGVENISYRLKDDIGESVID